MSTRGLSEQDFKRVVHYIDQAVKYAVELQQSLPKDANKLKDFKAAAVAGDSRLTSLKQEIAQWASQFPLPV
jgi:glycine hydroxymethyltransferase